MVTSSFFHSLSDELQLDFPEIFKKADGDGKVSNVIFIVFYDEIPRAGIFLYIDITYQESGGFRELLNFWDYIRWLEQGCSKRRQSYRS